MSLASDACTRGNVLNDMAENITQLAFDYLDAPPVVVGAKNWITPAFEFDHEFFPQPEWILDAIHGEDSSAPRLYADTELYQYGADPEEQARRMTVLKQKG